MNPIRLSRHLEVPIYRQIIDQIAFLIDEEQLKEGDSLPSSRMLAANLHVNRNTVARAYAELRSRGYLKSAGRSGMMIKSNPTEAQVTANRDNAVQVLETAIAQCREMGLTSDEIATIAYQMTVLSESAEISLAVVECNEERAKSFATTLSEKLGLDAEPLVLGTFTDGSLRDCDVVVTTFFHLVEVRRLIDDARISRPPELVGTVMTPHVKTLVELAKFDSDTRKGILYSTSEQADLINASITDAGLGPLEEIHESDPLEDPPDVVLVPSENPELAMKLPDTVHVVEFGNVLDSGSLKAVAQVVEDLRRQNISGVRQ